MIEIYDDLCGDERYSNVEEVASFCSVHLDPQERLNDVKGKAFDWKTWYKAWSSQQPGESYRMPTHLRVTATDEFQATIPWEQLELAFFLYEQEGGKPLEKGYPMRLYVPDGSSDCLNVKSVTKIQVLYDLSLGTEAAYGYMNRVSPEQLQQRHTI